MSNLQKHHEQAMVEEDSCDDTTVENLRQECLIEAQLYPFNTVVSSELYKITELYQNTTMNIPKSVV